MKEYQTLELNTLVHRLNTGNVQLAYNADLNIQILVIGKDNEFETEYEYSVYFIKKDKVIKTAIMGMTNKVGYYAAKEIARQDTNLPSELKL